MNNLDVQMRDSLLRVKVKRITEFIDREWGRERFSDEGFGE